MRSEKASMRAGEDDRCSGTPPTARAGSVVVRDVPDGATVAGNPARRLR